MPVALTRAISPRFAECELTHLDRNPIDVSLAQKQHHEYEQALEKMGYTLRRLPETPGMPDGVFVEDTAVVLPEIAIITRPGAKSRRPETESMASVLREYRKLQFIDTPGTMDGGDVLVMGKRIYIGKSGRTNTDAIRQFSDLTAPYGYKVTAVPVKGCLHLKTAIAPLETDLLLINPYWTDPAIFKEYKTLSIHPSEPFGANVMRRENKTLCQLSCPRTADLLHRQGYELLTVDQSELAKAEAGLTCCSVIVNE